MVNNSINVQPISAGGSSMLRHRSVTFSGSELLVGGVGDEGRSQLISTLLGLKQHKAGWVGVGSVGGVLRGVLLCCDKSHVDILSPSAPGPQ